MAIYRTGLRVSVSIMAVIASLLVCAPLAAQTYPAKPVRVVLSSPGGGNDVMARLAAENMSRLLGVLFFVESRQPNVAASTFVARSAPDGYTLMAATASYLVNTLLQPAPYHPLNDFTAVTQLGTTPIVVIVHPALPVRTLRDLVVLAKSRPAELNYGSGGISSPLHLAGELFTQTTGVDIVHVPFKGTANATTDLQAGRIQVMFPSIVSVAQQIKAGRVRVIAIMSDRRSDELPEVPTTREAGVPNLTANIWYGMLAPAGLPAPLLEKLNKAAVAAVNLPQVAGRMRTVGVEPVGSTPEQFAAFAAAELVKWKRVIDTGKLNAGT